MRILAFLFEGLVVLAAVALMIGLVRLVMRLLAMIALLTAGVGLALIGAILAGFSAQTIIGHYGGPEPDSAGTLIGLLVFAGLVLVLVRKLIRHFDETQALTDRLSGMAPQTTEPPQAPENDPTVRDAWEQALVLAPAEAPRLHAARARCARLLQLAEGNATDSELIECGVLVRRNVPELVGRVAALWDSVDPAEQAEKASGLVEDLERLARRSDLVLERHRQILRDNLQIVRTHVANRTEGDVTV